jgi:hypothetical protein
MREPLRTCLTFLDSGAIKEEEEEEEVKSLSHFDIL